MLSQKLGIDLYTGKYSNSEKKPCFKDLFISISAPSCDHFGRPGEWEKKNLAKLS